MMNLKSWITDWIKNSLKLHFNSTIDKEVEAIKKEISDKEEFKPVLAKLSLDYLAVKLLEEDKHLIDVLKNDYKISDVSFTNSYTTKLVKEYDEDIETTIKRADTGLYEAKAKGRNQAIMF